MVTGLGPETTTSRCLPRRIRLWSGARFGKIAGKSFFLTRILLLFFDTGRQLDVIRIIRPRGATRLEKSTNSRRRGRQSSLVPRFIHPLAGRENFSKRRYHHRATSEMLERAANSTRASFSSRRVRPASTAMTQMRLRRNFDGAHTDHRNIKPHVLLRFRDLNHDGVLAAKSADMLDGFVCSLESFRAKTFPFFAP